MAARAASRCVIVCALACVGPAHAAALEMPVDIGAGPLSSSLQTLERQTGIELLFDAGLVGHREAPAVSGKLTTEQALAQLLSDSGLAVRRSSSGAWLIERPVTAALAQQDVAVAEILVVGRRTQNADIRRFENDVQPYTVVTGEQLLATHRDNVGQFFASHVTADTLAIPPGLQQTGITRSEIDLRGLGSEQTLVLVDGRRMPSVSAAYFGFLQSDLNGIPLHAIDRIEILTGTAGGIHGFGALGGAVNVVLDHRASGVELYYTGGVSSRGDGQRQSLEGRFGHSFGDGATDFSVFASHSESDTVLAGERDFAARDRRRTFELNPDYYQVYYPNGNSVSVASIDQSNLVFKPEFGGSTLTSDHTYLPAGFAGSSTDLVSALTQHAGEKDFALTKDEWNTDLGTNPTSDAAFANLRHRFGERFEAYVDAVWMRSQGISHGDELHSTLTGGFGLVAPTATANPFTSYITVHFPIEGLAQEVWTRTESTRYTAGLVAELPAGWRGTAEFGAGGYRNERSYTSQIPSQSFIFLSGDETDPDLSPLGDWKTFQRAVSADPNGLSDHDSLHTKFHDLSLRAAGPVYSTDAGPATLTLLAERRQEDIPAFQTVRTNFDHGAQIPYGTTLKSRSTETTSLYAELRTRLFDESSTNPFVRALELQLAARHDRQSDNFAAQPTDEDSTLIHSEFAGTTYTAGAKVSPASWLMLRGSYATGEQPPPLDYLVEVPDSTTDFPLDTDPKRGNTVLGTDGTYLLRSGGDPTLNPVRASTLSLGTVLTPFGSDGARIAIDFSRVRRNGDVFLPAFSTIMDNEDAWPERVGRAPLTDEDRAKGYTAGRVTMFDMRVSDAASVRVDAIDLRLDWPLALSASRLQFYLDATHNLRNVQKAPFQPDVNQVSFREGPLKWKANGGVDWSKGSLSLSANAQYYASSAAYKDEPEVLTHQQVVETQGSSRIPSQWYLDLSGNWRIPIPGSGPLDEVTLALGLINVLDKAPPRVSFLLDGGPGYSRYGDPRMRRFELTLSCHF